MDRDEGTQRQGLGPVLTVPNLISFTRLLGVPLFLYLFLGTDATGWAVVVLVVGGLSDWVEGETRLKRLLRSDDLNDLALSAQRFLIDYGVRTVIDLRDPEELERAPDPFAVLPDVRYVHLPFFDDSGRKIGPPDLSQSKGFRYLRWFKLYPGNIRAIFEAIAAAEQGITLFHCAAGKDRTGMVAGMMLALAGVPDDHITADYAISFDLLKPSTALLRERAIQTGEDMNLFERRAACLPESMQEVLDGLRSKYGGVANYLRRIGLTEAHATTLETRLLP